MSDTCNSGCSQEPELYLAKVVNVPACDPNGAPQQAYETPFYDEMLPNKLIIIPKVGGTFTIDTISANRWAAGQWAVVDGVGKFKVVSVVGGKTLVLENTGINDGLEIGSQYHGARKVWPADGREESQDDEALSSLQNNLVNPNFEFCAMTENATEADNGFASAAIVTSSICDPCSKENPDSKLVRCYRIFKNIIFKWLTIALPSIPKANFSSVLMPVEGIETEKPLLPVFWHPKQGDLYAMDPPAAHAMQSYDPSKGMSYVTVPQDHGDKCYVLSVNKDTGKIAFRELTFKVPVYIGVAVLPGLRNVKSILESNLNITLPNTGTVVISVRATILNDPATEAFVDGNSAAITGVTDVSASGNVTVEVDLSDPTIEFGAMNQSISYKLEQAFIPIGMLYNQ